MSKTEEKRGLHRTFASIANQAETILDNIAKWNLDYFNAIVSGGEKSKSAREALDLTIVYFTQNIGEATGLRDSYNAHIFQYQNLTGHSLRFITINVTQDLKSAGKESVYLILPALRGFLRELIVECHGAMGSLEESLSTVPAVERDRLEALKKELASISSKTIDSNFERNLLEAIDECEQGHNLAAWLIAGRVVRYIFQEIHGHDIDGKIQFLKEQKIISKQEEQIVQLMNRIDKETSNIAAHNIASFPQPKDVLSLIANCLKIIESIWVRVQETH